MKVYIKASESAYYRIDHIGAKDKDQHFGTASFAELKYKLKQFGLPEILAEFGDIQKPNYIDSEVWPNGTIVNSYSGWNVSKRNL